MITPDLRRDHAKQAAFLDNHALDCAEVESIVHGYPMRRGGGPEQQALKIMAQFIANDREACQIFESDFTFHDQYVIRARGHHKKYFWATRPEGTSIIKCAPANSDYAPSLQTLVRLHAQELGANAQWHYIHIGSIVGAVTPLTFEQTLDVARRIDNVQV